MTGSYWRFSRVFLAVASPALMSGGLFGVRVGDVMIRPEVGEYGRLALVGLQPESEVRFREMFLEALPEWEFADREDILGILSEEDFLSGILGVDATRRIGRSLGVRGVMVVTWEDRGTGGTVNWNMTITNTDSGETTGTATARVRREPLARGATFDDLERQAFEALISLMEDRFGG